MLKDNLKKYNNKKENVLKWRLRMPVLIELYHWWTDKLLQKRRRQNFPMMYLSSTKELYDILERKSPQ